MKKTLFICLALLPLNAGALELFLEENRGESGTVGYVDMDRVFREYSGTTGAREEFLSEVRKREGELDAAKKRIFALKAEIARLRQEREFAAALPLFFGEDAAQESSSATARGAGPSTGEEPALSTAAAALPGMSPAGAPASLAAETALPAAEAQRPAGQQPMIYMPGVGAVSLEKFRMSVSTSAADIEAAIADREKSLEKSESELRAEQRKAEKDLLARESKKTEEILGRIYFLLRELAVSEGVSVVIDKRSILFGHAAVDLTGKLIEMLERGGNGEDK